MYEVVFKRMAEKSIAQLPGNTYQRVTRAIDNLSEEPRAPGCIRLRGRDDWRIKVGDYRVVYGIDDGRRMVEILHIAHRRDIYRQG